MAKNAHYRVAYRRRREQKTDYQARRILATSEHPRFVVRASNKGILAQIVKAEIIGDKVLTQASLQRTCQQIWLASEWKEYTRGIPPRPHRWPQGD